MALALLAALALLQDDRKPYDVLQLQSGALMVGRITELTPDFLRIKVDGEAEPRLVPVRDLAPYCVYRLRRERIDPADPSARFVLAEFCFAHDLLRTSISEFTESGRAHSRLSPEDRKARSVTRMKERQALVTCAKALLADEKRFTARELLELSNDPDEGAPAVAGAEALEAEIARGIPTTPAAAFEKGLDLYKAAQAAGVKLDRENREGNMKSKFKRLLHLPAPAELLISKDAADLLQEKSASKDPDEQTFAKTCLKLLSCPDRLRDPKYVFLPAPVRGEYAVYYYR